VLPPLFSVYLDSSVNIVHNLNGVCLHEMETLKNSEKHIEEFQLGRAFFWRGKCTYIYTSQYLQEVVGVVLVVSTPEDYRARFLPTMPEEFQDAYNKQFVYEGTYDEFMASLKQLKESKHYGVWAYILFNWVCFQWL
jgi:hypothetical protein